MQKKEKTEKELKEKGLNEEQIEEELSTFMLKNIDDFLDVVLKIAYILILSADSKFDSFENWLRSIETIKVSDSWIQEVTELAVNSFRG